MTGPDPSEIRCVHCQQILWTDPTRTGVDEKLLNLRITRHTRHCPAQKPATA